MSRMNKEVEIAAMILMILGPTLAACAGSAQTVEPSSPSEKKDIQPGVTKTPLSTPLKVLETPTPQEKKWDVGPIEPRYKVDIFDSNGGTHTLEFFVTPGSKLEVTDQASLLMSFFLNQFKRSPNPLADFFKIIFTETTPPEDETLCAVTSKSENASAISLRKLREPFGGSIDPEYQIKVNMAFAAELCNLLLEPADFSPQDPESVNQGLVCDSIGVAVGYAIGEISYDQYLKEIVYYRYLGLETPDPLLIIDRTTYDALGVAFGGKPPILV